MGTQSAVRTPIATPGSPEIIASPSPSCSPFLPQASSTCAECTCRTVVNSGGGVESRKPKPCASQENSRFGDVIKGRNFHSTAEGYIELMQQPGESSRTDDRTPPRTFDLLLVGIALTCLIPSLSLAVSQFVEYDGYWHVWIAQQDRWANFIREYQGDAHPPIFYLLLRATLWLGRTQLVYRLISLLSGTASIWLLGRTALKAMRSPVWAALAALAYGLAMPTIITSNEVRGYMLASFLIQISFYYFLDLLSEQQPPTVRPRAIFVVMAAIACETEYTSLFYVAAAMLFALVLPLLRRQKDWIRAELREIATFVAILAIPVAEYISHIGGKTVAYDHLPDFYFQPATGESAVAFLLRNLRNELNLFSPWKVPEGTGFYAAMGLLLAGAAAIVFLTRKWSAPKNLPALASLLLPMIMMCALMAAALIRAYPFGGFLRQQFILFPFLAVCPFLFLDHVLSGIPRPTTRIVAGVVVIAVTAVSVQNYQAFPKVSGVLLTDQMSRYNRMFPAAEGIYIDQFNLITFFMHHHNWKWEFVAPLPGSADGQVYRLSRDNRSMLLFRDMAWQLDLREPELYTLLARSMRHWQLSSVTIFSIAQIPGKTRTQEQVEAYRARVLELAATQGLCQQTLELDNYDVYAEFRTGGCAIK